MENAFYASILGAVLFGIGIALVIEWKRRDGGLVGLRKPSTFKASSTCGAKKWLISPLILSYLRRRILRRFSSTSQVSTSNSQNCYATTLMHFCRFPHKVGRRWLRHNEVAFCGALADFVEDNTPIRKPATWTRYIGVEIE